MSKPAKDSGEVEHVAKAMYDANEFVRGWFHPKTTQLWHAHYRKQARAAIRAYNNYVNHRYPIDKAS